MAVAYVSWGEVINGGFGMMLDGSSDAERLKSMLHWDVNNGIHRKETGRNEGATFAIKTCHGNGTEFKVTIPNLVDDSELEGLF